jgi:hypothetical protein
MGVLYPGVSVVGFRNKEELPGHYCLRGLVYSLSVAARSFQSDLATCRQFSETEMTKVDAGSLPMQASLPPCKGASGV